LGWEGQGGEGFYLTQVRAGKGRERWKTRLVSMLHLSREFMSAHGVLLWTMGVVESVPFLVSMLSAHHALGNNRTSYSSLHPHPLRPEKLVPTPCSQSQHLYHTHTQPPMQPYNCTSLFSNLTSSPGVNAGSPIYGHPSQRNASPRAQLPQLPTLPWTVKSTSARSSWSSFRLLKALSAEARFAASSASIFSFMPHVQSLQARRRLPYLGRHSGAVKGKEEGVSCGVPGVVQGV